MFSDSCTVCSSANGLHAKIGDFFHTLINDTAHALSLAMKANELNSPFRKLIFFTLFTLSSALFGRHTANYEIGALI